MYQALAFMLQSLHFQSTPKTYVHLELLQPKQVVLELYKHLFRARCSYLRMSKLQILLPQDKHPAEHPRKRVLQARPKRSIPHLYSRSLARNHTLHSHDL
jgi:hypothetical protein